MLPICGHGPKRGNGLGFTALRIKEDGGRVHEWTGYLALAVASARVALGLFASGYRRFGQFVRGLRDTWAYAVAVWRRREPHFLGHNPLGGWMVLALHVAGVVFTSLRQRENLIVAMVLGRKRDLPDAADR